MPLLTEEEKKAELPVTDTDRMVINIFKDRQTLISRKKLILDDIAQHISSHPALKEKWAEDGQLMSLFHEELWPIALGGGYAVKIFFEVLKDYHPSNPADERVIYNQLGRGQQIEYYAVPNSYVFVSRVVPSGGQDILSTYAMVTRSPDIWRSSFSVHNPKRVPMWHQVLGLINVMLRTSCMLWRACKLMPSLLRWIGRPIRT